MPLSRLLSSIRAFPGQVDVEVLRGVGRSIADVAVLGSVAGRFPLPVLLEASR